MNLLKTSVLSSIIDMEASIKKKENIIKNYEIEKKNISNDYDNKEYSTYLKYCKNYDIKRTKLEIEILKNEIEYIKFVNKIDAPV